MPHRKEGLGLSTQTLILCQPRTGSSKLHLPGIKTRRGRNAEATTDRVSLLLILFFRGLPVLPVGLYLFNLFPKILLNLRGREP